MHMPGDDRGSNRNLMRHSSDWQVSDNYGTINSPTIKINEGLSLIKIKSIGWCSRRYRRHPWYPKLGNFWLGAPRLLVNWRISRRFCYCQTQSSLGGWRSYSGTPYQGKIQACLYNGVGKVHAKYQASEDGWTTLGKHCESFLKWAKEGDKWNPKIELLQEVGIHDILGPSLVADLQGMKEEDVKYLVSRYHAWNFGLSSHNQFMQLLFIQ